MSPYRILHLSDMHFGKYCGLPDPQPDRLATEVLETLRRDFPTCLPVQALVLSGDFVWGCCASDYKLAEQFCEILRKEVLWGIGKLFLLPGNHDIQWLDQNTGRPTTYSRAAAEDPYRKFRANVMGSRGDSGPAGLGFLHFDAAEQVALVGLNSTRWECQQTRGAGYVGFDQVYELLEESDQARRIHAEAGKVQVVGFLHHGLLSGFDAAPSRGPGWSVQPCADSLRLCQALRHYGVNLVTHGHIHKHVHWPSHNPSFADDWMPGPKGPIDIRAVGSPSVLARFSGGDHHFQLIEMFPAQAKYVVHEWTTSPETTDALRLWNKHPPMHRRSERFLPASHYLPSFQRARVELARNCEQAARVWEEWLMMESLVDGDKEAFHLARRRVKSLLSLAAAHDDEARRIVNLPDSELDDRLWAAILGFRSTNPDPADVAMGRRLKKECYEGLEQEWNHALEAEAPAPVNLTAKLISALLEQLRSEVPSGA